MRAALTIMAYWLGFTLVTSLNAQTLRPETDLIPPPAFAPALTAEGSNPDQKRAALVAAVAESPFEENWRQYLLGILSFEINDYEQGLTEFQIPVSAVNSLEQNNVHGDEFRLAAKCLKKLGWFERQQKNYPRAYELHRQAYEIADRFGSWSELHDATVSMDVDCDLMGMSSEAAEWAERGIAAAQNIADVVKKSSALGACYNNLAFDLQKQGKHSAAEQAMLSSLNHWMEYEAAKGTREHRVVWSYYGLGDVYEFSVKDEKDSTKRAQLLAKSRVNYEKALELARQQAMSPEDTAEIEKRLNSLPDE